MGSRFNIAAVGGSLLTLVGIALAASGTQGPPVYVSSGGAPSGACSGERVWMTRANPSDTYCCISNVWARCGVGTSTPIPNCAPGEFVTADGGGLICKTLSSVEVDPKSYHVGALPLCASYEVLRNSDAGFSCERMANVYSAGGWPMGVFALPNNTYGLYLDSVGCSNGEVMTFNGSSWTCDTIAAAESDPRVPHCPGGSSLHTTDDAGTLGCVDDIPPAYGHIEEAHAGSTIVLTTADVYYPWVTGNCRDTLNMTCQQGAGVDAGTDLGGFLKIERSGEYRVSFTSSISSSVNNQTIEADLFIVKSRGDTGTAGETEKCATSSKFGNTDEQAMSFACVVSLVVGDIVGVRFDRETGTSTTLTIAHASLTLTNIAPTVAVGVFSGNYVQSLTTPSAGGLVGGVPPAQAADLTLRIQDCGQGKMLKSFDGGWSCVTEDDPLSIHEPGCGFEEFPIVGLMGWECSSKAPSASYADLAGGVTASCPSGQVLTSGDAGLSCVSVTESDPLSIHVGAIRTCPSGQSLSNGDAGFSCVSETDPTAVHITGTETVIGAKTFSSSTKFSNDILYETQPSAYIAFNPSTIASTGASGSNLYISGQGGGDTSGLGGAIITMAGSGGTGYSGYVGGRGGIIGIFGGPGGSNTSSTSAGKGGYVVMEGGTAGTSSTKVSGGDVFVGGGYSNDDAQGGGIVYLGARRSGSPYTPEPEYSYRQTSSVQTWARLNVLANMTVGNTASSHVVSAVARGTVDVGTFAGCTGLAIGACCSGFLTLTDNSYYGDGNVVACSGYRLKLGFATICSQTSTSAVFVQVCRVAAGDGTGTPTGSVNAIVFN